MNIAQFLSERDVLINVSALNKQELLQDLAARAATAVGIPAEQISSEVLKREGLGSTGMGGGVAIPHARVRALKKPFGILARLAKAIDFDAIDEKPVDLIFLLLLPDNGNGGPLNALASVARKLRDKDKVRNLRRAVDGGEVYRSITI